MQSLETRVPIVEALPVNRDNSVAEYVEFPEWDMEKRLEKGQWWMNQIRKDQKRKETYYEDAKEAIQVYKGKDCEPEVYLNILKPNTKALNAHIVPHDVKPLVRPEGTGNHKLDKINQSFSNIVQKFLESEMDRGQFNMIQRKKVENALVSGIGISRVYLDEDYNGKPKLSWEVIDHDDIFFPNCKSLKDADWVAQRLFVEEDQLQLYLDEFTMQNSPYPARPYDHYDEEFAEEDTQNRPDGYTIYEIWDCVNRERLFVRGEDEIVVWVEPDPYQLEDFYPYSFPVIPDTDFGMVPIPLYNSYKELHNDLQMLYKKDSDTLKQSAIKWLLAGTPSAQTKKWVKSDISEVFADPELSKQLMKLGATSLNDILIAFPFQEQVAFSQFMTERIRIQIEYIHQESLVSDLQRNQDMSGVQKTAEEQRLKAHYSESRLKGIVKQYQDSAKQEVKIASQFIARYGIQEISKITSHSFQPHDDLSPKEAADKAEESMQLVELINNPRLGQVSVDVETMSVSAANTQIDMEKAQLAEVFIDKMFMKLMTPEVQKDIKVMLGTIEFYMGIIGYIRIDPDRQRQLDAAINPLREELSEEIERMLDPQYAEDKKNRERREALENNPDFLAKDGEFKVKMQTLQLEAQKAVYGHEFNMGKLQNEQTKIQADAINNAEKNQIETYKVDTEAALKQRGLEIDEEIAESEIEVERAKIRLGDPEDISIEKE